MAIRNHSNILSTKPMQSKVATALAAYFAEINGQYRTGNATEHSYRPALKTLLEALLPGVTVINEPKQIDCGAPDYILMKNDLPVSFVEAKDIGDSDLAGRRNNRSSSTATRQDSIPSPSRTIWISGFGGTARKSCQSGWVRNATAS